MGEQTFIKIRKMLGISLLFLFAISMVSVASSYDCTYGPDTCKQGYVWRGAVPSDRVCVTPEVREQTRIDNSLADQRRNPIGGAYGPNTCIVGYVWRDAFPGDVVCVLPQTRAQAAEDNSQAAQRKACVY
jgi:hypothetical protein